MTDPRKLSGRSLAEALQKYCASDFAKTQAADLKRQDDAAMAQFLAERGARVRAGTATPREVRAHVRVLLERKGENPGDPAIAAFVEACVKRGKV